MDAIETSAIKLVIVGDGSVGKTCILMSYTQDKFPDVYIPTIFENYCAQIQVDNKMINLSLWYTMIINIYNERDTAGQEEYDKLREISYPQSDIFLITFSVDQPASLTNAVSKWYRELQLKAPNVPKIFVGNKIDLRKTNDDNFVQFGVAQKVISDMGCKYVECSALSQQGLKTVFDEAIRAVLKLKTQQSIQQKPQQQEQNSIKPKQVKREEEQVDDKSGCHIS